MPMKYLCGVFVYLPQAARKLRCSLHRRTSTSSDAVNSDGEQQASPRAFAMPRTKLRGYSFLLEETPRAHDDTSMPEGITSGFDWMAYMPEHRKATGPDCRRANQMDDCITRYNGYSAGYRVACLALMEHKPPR